MLVNLNLIINCNKTMCMIFRPKTDKSPVEPRFSLGDYVLNNVLNIKYLGIILSNDLTNKFDIERCERSFLKQFNCIYRKFSFADVGMISYLFQAHCMSFYGSELWYDNDKSLGAFRTVEINYHKAIKRMQNLSYRESNHVACEALNMLTFKHLINKKMISFAFQVLRSRSLCLFSHIPYLKYYSQFISKVKSKAYKDYGIEELFENDMDAIKSRIYYVQCREDRYVRQM